MQVATSWLACLALLATPVVDSETSILNVRDFTIPIRFSQPERRAEIKVLRLFVSRDVGKTWELAAEATPDAEAFPFHADKEGPYWFKLQLIDQAGNTTPANIREGPVGQKVLVQTSARPAVPESEIDQLRADLDELEKRITEIEERKRHKREIAQLRARLQELEKRVAELEK